MLSHCRDIDGDLGAKEKSIIDRCTSIVYRDDLLHGCVGEVPTMKAFYDTLLDQDELEAKELALALELYINGNLNIFAKTMNVNLQSRLVYYQKLCEIGAFTEVQHKMLKELMSDEKDRMWIKHNLLKMSMHNHKYHFSFSYFRLNIGCAMIKRKAL